MAVLQNPNRGTTSTFAGPWGTITRYGLSPNELQQQTAIYQADTARETAQANANAQVEAARYGMQGQVANGMAAAMGAYAQPYNAFTNSNADMYRSYSGLLGQGAQTFGQMYDSYSKAFQGFGNAVGQVASANANADANRYGAYAQGNTGYQNMLGALGASALGAYGSAANAALQSQAIRETAAMKMMADAAAANQAALASYGGQQASALSGLGKSYADAASGLGASRAGLAQAAAGLGSTGANAMANVAGNSMNFTRDMGKLDLARLLGTGQINAMGQFAAPGGSLSIGGPGGQIAGGSYGGFAGGSAPYSMPNTPTWYSNPQYYDAGGKQGVLDAMAVGSGAIGKQADGLRADSKRTFAGLADMGNRIGGSSILDALNSNYSKSWQDMLGVYQQGRQDPNQLLQSVFQNTQAMTSPFMQAGQGAYNQFLSNFPQPTSQGGAYMDTLLSGWTPFVSNLNSAMAQQNANVLGSLLSGRQAYDVTRGQNQHELGNAYGMLRQASRGPSMNL